MLRPPAIFVSLCTAVLVALAGLGFVAVPAAPAQAATVTSSRLPATIDDAIPADYSAPAAALYVAPGGSDSATGTPEAPFATLAKAMKTVKAGGTIVLRGGVYREGAGAATGFNTGGTYYTSLPAGVTIQSYPGETVWLDGTVRISSWKKVSKKDYKVSWSTPDLCAQKYYTRKPSSPGTSGPCSFPDAVGSGASLGDPQMLFRNGKQLTQVSSLKKMTSTSKFYYDWSKKVLHVRFNPSGSTVEATRFAQALALYQPSNLSIKGIGFRRYASNQYTNATGGAVLLNGGSTVLVERSVFTENAGAGLLVWQTTGLTVRQSVLSGNGSNGLYVDGVWAKRAAGYDVTDDLVIESSRLDDNNRDRYGVNCTWACGAAGAKVTGTVGITLRDSSFSRNGGGRGSGFWCDLGCGDLTAYRNDFIDNDRHGLVYEVSSGAVVASNLFVRNGWDSPAYGGGYALYIGSADVRVYNNTLVDNNAGVAIYDDARSAAGENDQKLGANTVGVDFVNNIVTGGSSKTGRQLAVSGADLKYAGNTTASSVVGTISHNSYYNPSGGSKYWLAWTEHKGATTEIFTSVDAVIASKGHEVGSELVRSGANPFLTAPASGDYSVKGDSEACGSAAELPADIADLLGVARSGHDRGVIADR